MPPQSWPTMMALSSPWCRITAATSATRRGIAYSSTSFGLVAPVVAALVDGDDFEIALERRHLIAPRVPEVGEAVDHDHERAVADARVMDLDAVAVGMAARRRDYRCRSRASTRSAAASIQSWLIIHLGHLVHLVHLVHLGHLGKGDGSVRRRWRAFARCRSRSKSSSDTDEDGDRLPVHLVGDDRRERQERVPPPADERGRGDADAHRLEEDRRRRARAFGERHCTSTLPAAIVRRRAGGAGRRSRRSPRRSRPKSSTARRS